MQPVPIEVIGEQVSRVGQSGEARTSLTHGRNILTRSTIRVPLHPVTLAFRDPEVERAFRFGVTPSGLVIARWSLLLAVTIYATYAVVEEMAMPGVPLSVHLVKIGTGVVFLLALALTYHRRIRSFYGFLMGAVVLLGGLGIVSMHLLTPTEHAQYYYIGIILAVVYAHVLLRMRFLHATIACVLLLAMFVTGSILVRGAGDPLLLTDTYFLVAANVMGMFASYGFEYFIRTVHWQERLLSEQAIRLAAEDSRKSAELDAVRQLQLSMLPEAPPSVPGYEFAFVMGAATEIGGDYYDHIVAPDGQLTFAIGDATGHGAQAGAMVTAAKLLFTEYAPQMQPADFLREASRALRRMRFQRLYMAMAVGKLCDHRLTLSGAGIPPALLRRASTGEIEHLSLSGLPLGSPADLPRDSRTTNLEPGDTVVLMTDGFHERVNGSGEQIGYEAPMELLREYGDEDPEALLRLLMAASNAWAGGSAPNDDVTVVIMRRAPEGQTAPR